MSSAMAPLFEAEGVFEIQDDDIDRYAVVRFAPESEEVAIDLIEKIVDVTFEVAMTDFEKREFWGRRSISKNSRGHKRATEFDGAGFDPAPFKLIDNTFQGVRELGRSVWAIW